MVKSSPLSLSYLALFAAASGLGDWLSQTVALTPDSGLILRPAMGLYLGVLLLDRGHWPRWLLAIFAVDGASSSLILATDPALGLCFAAGHTVQALLSASLLMPGCGAPFVLNGPRPVMALGLFGGILGPAVGAGVSAAASATIPGDFSSQTHTYWLLWWLADGTSAVIFVPMVLVLAEWRDTWREASAARWGESAILAAAFVGVAWLFLHGDFPFGYIIMVPLAWAALRFEIAGASMAMCLLSLLVLIATASGQGIFAHTAFSPEARQGHAQLFLAVVAMASLLMAALTRQRRESLQALESVHRNLEARFAARTAELRESEARFRAIADYTYDWESWVGEDGKPIWINPAVQRFTGLSVAECAALPHYPIPLIHPDDRGVMAELFREALQGRAANDVEFRILHRDGREIWCAASWQPIVDAGGRPLGYRSSIRDTSERKRLEDERRDGAEAFRAMFAVSSVGKIEADVVSGRFLKANAAFCRITGYSEAELLRRSFAQITHPDDLAADMEQRQRVIKGDKPYFEMEKRYIRADGGIIWAQVTLNAIRNPAGRVIRMTGVIQDITQRKTTELALQQSQRDLARAQEVGQIGSWRFQLRSHALNLSDQCYRIFAVDLGEPVVLQSLLAIIHPEDRGVLASHWRRFLSEQKTFELEHRVILSGHLKWLRVKAYPEFDDKGQLQACFGITQDITELKRRVLEIEYLATHDSLTQLPNRRLLMDRLQQAIALARRENRKLAVLYIDLDKFKPINDTYGHSMGDRVLEAVGERLKLALRRETDSLARIGGDEFILLLPNISSDEEMTAVAQEVIRAVNRPFILGNCSLSVGASIGMASFPEHGSDAATLIEHADRALYTAKALGSNRYRFFEPSAAKLERIPDEAH